jgi:uncharacterized repeat protein (TIGR02543 family)
LFAVALALAIIAPSCFGFGVSKAEAGPGPVTGGDVNWDGPNVQNIYVDNLADLQTAIATAEANGVTTSTAIKLTHDIIYDGTVGKKGIEIPEGARIKLMSVEGGHYKIDANQQSKVIHMGAQKSSLTLENITITGGNAIGADTYGGGVSVGSAENNCKLILNAGAKITRNTAYTGGGVRIYTGDLIMNGGEISHNEAVNKGNGGGVYIGSSNAHFTMNDGKITNNNAAMSGGGVNIGSKYAGFTMNGGEISDNTAKAGNGGGIYVSDYSKLDIPAKASVSFSGNTASKLYRLSDNVVPRDFAGSISSISVPYLNVLNGFDTDTADAVLSANKKSVFNNYDINYTLVDVDAVEDEGFYTVNYDLNGGLYKKAPNIAAKESVKWNDEHLLPDGDSYDSASMTKEGYVFVGWNVSLGGGRAGVTGADKYSDLSKDGTAISITLTAQWTPIPPDPATPDKPPATPDKPTETPDKPEPPVTPPTTPPTVPITPVKPSAPPSAPTTPTTPGKPTPSPAPATPATPPAPPIPNVSNTENTDKAGDTVNTVDMNNTEDSPDIPNDEKPTGGTDRYLPPRPAAGGSVVSVPGVENAYVEIGEDGTPLGEWHYNDDIGEWIFDEYPPLAALNASGKLPRTGAVIPNATGSGPAPFVLLMGFASLCAGIIGLRYRQG